MGTPTIIAVILLAAIAVVAAKTSARENKKQNCIADYSNSKYSSGRRNYIQGVVCGCVTEDGNRGTISFPTWHANSTDLLKGEYIRCVWEIRRPLGYQIIFNFTNLFHHSCRNTVHLKLNALTGNVYLSNVRYPTFDFCSEESNYYSSSTSWRGAAIRLARITGQYPEHQNKPPKPLPPPFNLAWEVKCGGVLTLRHVDDYITSPGYPSSYLHNQDCTWVIPTSKTPHVRLEFYMLKLQMANCDCVDKLEITWMKNGTKSVICELPDGPLIGEGDVTIRFTSDNQHSDVGFLMKVFRSSIPCLNIEPSILSPITRIVSPGPDGRYPDLCHCVWTIRPPTGVTLKLGFSKFEVAKYFVPHPSSDQLAIHLNDSTYSKEQVESHIFKGEGAGVIANDKYIVYGYTASKKPQDVTFKGTLTIEFYSNKWVPEVSTKDRGFTAEITKMA